MQKNKIPLIVKGVSLVGILILSVFSMKASAEDMTKDKCVTEICGLVKTNCYDHKGCKYSPSCSGACDVEYTKCGDQCGVFTGSAKQTNAQCLETLCSPAQEACELTCNSLKFSSSCKKACQTGYAGCESMCGNFFQSSLLHHTLRRE